MKKASSDPSEIKRPDVWFKAHTKKNGEPSSSKVAEYMKTYEELKGSQTSQSSTSSIKDDAISMLLGPERSSRVRGLGHGVTPSKVDALTKKGAKESKLEGEVAFLKENVMSMKQVMKSQAETIDRLTQRLSQRETSSNKGRKCKLLHWLGANEVVAIGCWATDDPSAVVHFVALGKGAVRVWVKEVVEPTCSLWRPTSELEIMEDAIGSSITWPKECILLIDN